MYGTITGEKRRFVVAALEYRGSECAIFPAQVLATFYQVLGAHHGGPEFWTKEVLDIEEKFLRELCL